MAVKVTKNKITRLKGIGTISSGNIVTVTNASKKKESYKAKSIVIATGSTPTSLKEIKIDKKLEIIDE